jgi:hypothetical protein
MEQCYRHNIFTIILSCQVFISFSSGLTTYITLLFTINSLTPQDCYEIIVKILCLVTLLLNMSFFFFFWVKLEIRSLEPMK